MSLAVQVTFDAHDPRALARFWSQALGYTIPGPPGRELSPDADPFVAWEEFLAANDVPPEEWGRAAAAEDPDGAGPRLYFQKVPEGKTAKNRVHLDLRVAPGLAGEERMAALEAASERLVALGATRVRRFEPEGMESGFIQMADPEGNEFCLD